MALSSSFGTSESTGTSQSTGGSYIPDYPQTPLLMEIAQYSRSLAPKMLDWATAEYNKGAAQSQALIDEGNKYASPSRIQQDMGRAEAGVQQAGDAARQSVLRDLAALGVDPSSGRYADLDQTERLRAFAAAAGAGNEQRMATEATGRAIRSEGLNLGAANRQFGATAMRLPNDYLGTAMHLPYPPLGHTQQSTSQNQSRSQNQSNSASQDSGGGGQGNKGGGGRGGGGQGDTGYGQGAGHDYRTGNQGQQNRGGGGGGRTPQTAKVTPIDQNSGGGRDQGSGVNSGYYNPDSFGQNSTQFDPNSPNYDPYSAYDPTSALGTQDWTNASSGWGDQYTNDNTGQNWNQGNQWDQGNWGATPDTSYADQQNADNQNWSDAYSSNYDQSTNASDTTGSTDQGYTPPPDQTQQDYSTQDQSYNDAYSSNYDQSGDTGYAEGGAIDQSMSPSDGEQTDDVDAQVQQTGQPAKLNVNEFVIPQDVALWMGQKFFQDLITKSRQARMGAPAKPSTRGGTEQAAAGGPMGMSDFRQGGSYGGGMGGGTRPYSAPQPQAQHAYNPGVSNWGARRPQPSAMAAAAAPAAGSNGSFMAGGGGGGGSGGSGGFLPSAMASDPNDWRGQTMMGS